MPALPQKARGDHRVGQYRAELFERLFELLLRKAFAKADIQRNVFVPLNTVKPSVVEVDFLVHTADASEAFKVRAPYRTSATPGIKRSLRDLQKFYWRYPDQGRIKRIVLALACDLPAGAVAEFNQMRKFFEGNGVVLEVWDSQDVWQHLKDTLHIRMRDFTVEALEQALGVQPPLASSDNLSPLQQFVGDVHEVITLVADFCSYSRFVHASTTDNDLVKSVMGRFYRSARILLSDQGAVFDKFMGDGLLAYFKTQEGGAAGSLQTVAQGLAGLAVKLALEWQEQVDLAVDPKGIRCGAALGHVLFIPESVDATGPVHAIGESINIAARLQAIAAPNTLVISNRLKTRYFDGRMEFTELPTAPLKNIGDVRAWQCLLDGGSA